MKHQGDQDDIETLLSAAGARAAPPEQMRERVHTNVLRAWEDLPDADQTDDRTRHWPRLAMAASVVLAAGLLLADQLLTPATEPIAVIDHATGIYRIDDDARSGATSVLPDQRLSVEDAPLSLIYDGAVTITLARHTRLQLGAGGKLRLESGRIYIDSDDRTAPVAVITPSATITDIGTQFDVQVYGRAGERTITAVRRGAIAIDSDSQQRTVRADADMGRLVRLHDGAIIAEEALAPTNAYWDWRRDGRKPFQLAGASVYDYLQWMARDSGRRIEFSRRAVEQTARLEHFDGGDTRDADQLAVSDVLETTTLQVRDPNAVIWRVDLRG